MSKIVYMLDFKGDKLQLGGTSNYLKMLVLQIHDKEYEVRIAMPASARTQELQAAIKKAGVPVDDVDTSPSSGGPLHRLNTSYRYFKRLQPDIVHFMLPWWNACEYGILGAWVAGVPLRIATYTAVPVSSDPSVFQGLMGRLRRQKQQLVCKLVNKATGVSDEVVRQIKATLFYHPRKVFSTKCAINVKDFAIREYDHSIRDELGVDKSAYLITLVGYLEEIKGHSFLLQALPEILKQHKHVEVLFVGDGILRNSLERQVRENNIAASVHFAGWRTDVPQILSVSDTLVLPSLSEGLPLVVLEAMAAALPVIATNVGGTPEAVIDGKTGILIPPASVPAIQEAVIMLLEDPDHAAKLGKAGQELAWAEFDIGRLVGEVTEIYRTVVNGKLN